MIHRVVFRFHVAPPPPEPLTLDEIADVVREFDLPESEVSY